MDKKYGNKHIIPDLPTLLSYSIFFLSIFIFLYYGIKGANWGFHWDEGKLYGGIKNVADSGVLLPRWYNYPSATFLITFGITNLTIGIDNFARVFGGGWTMYCLPNHLWVIPSLEYQTLINNSRAIFVVLGSFNALFIYTSCRLLNHSKITSALAGSLILGSFPIFYHSRWVTPDPLMLLMGNIAITSFLWAWTKPNNKRLLVTILASSLVLSSKYPGGLFLILPLIIANINGISIKKTTVSLIIYLILFILITPGSILDSSNFLRDIKYELHHYKTLGHGVWTVASTTDHIHKITSFFTFRALSSNSITSSTLFIGSCLGFILLFRQNRTLALSLSIVPILYIVYFSTQRVMFVRNILVVLPFFFLFLGVLINYFEKNLKNREFLLSIGILLCILPSWINHIASTNSLFIREEVIKTEISNYIDVNKNENILISKSVWYLLPKGLQKNFVNWKDDNKTNIQIICELGDLNLRTEKYILPELLGRYANKPNLYEVIAGANELDINYYPDWLGKKRYVTIYGQEAYELAKLNPECFWKVKIH